MNIITVRSEGIASLSYIIISNGEAMVIDPRRDAQIYVNHASEHQAVITHIFETHRHEDYVIGSLELQHLVPSAIIGHSKETAFEYGNLSLKDGDTFQIGGIEIECIHTPGHTDDSICYLLSDMSVGPDPIVIFTGDTLFVNEVGRTDLVDIKKHGLMSKKLFHSLHDKLLQLDDGVIVYPGHGAGSVCGGKIASRDFSTIGYERRNNYWLSLNEEDFVRQKIEQKLTRSKYFKVCEKLNTVGPPIISGHPNPRALPPDEFESLLKDPRYFAIDVRTLADFSLGHIPSSINLPLEALGQIAGWVLEYSVELLLILENDEQVGYVRNLLFRLGFDNVFGIIEGGIREWISVGKPLQTLGTFTSTQLKEEISLGAVILDVREDYEGDIKPIAESVSVPLTSIRSHFSTLDKESSYVAMCPSGFRSAAAASLMQKLGFNKIGVHVGGVDEWITSH